MRQMVIEDRIKLGGMLQCGVERKRIIEILGFNDRTIRREIDRGAVDGIYYPKVGQEYVDKGRRNNGRARLKLGKNNGYKEELLERLEGGLCTPDSIAGKKRLDGEEFVCTKTIYNYVWMYDEGLKKLLTYKKRYRKRHSRQGKRPEGYRHISERGEDIEQRKNVGDMEIDLVMSKGNKAGIMTLVDRKSRFGLICKVKSKKNEVINRRLGGMIKKEGIQKKLNSITNDNGHEFFGLRHLEKKFGFKQFYADPYSSQQRGTNEQYNGQIRKIFPKGTIFSKVPTKILQKIQTKLNRKPRKILGYKTPEEVFYSS